MKEREKGKKKTCLWQMMSIIVSSSISPLVRNLRLTRLKKSRLLRVEKVKHGYCSNG